MSGRNLLGLPVRQSTFPDGLETESGIHCNDLSGGAWFDRMAEQSPLTGYEPNSLIEISIAHTPIIFPSRRNNFRTDFHHDVPTIAASDGTDTLDAGVTSPLFTQEREVNPFSDSVHRQAAVSGRSNTKQPASSKFMHDGKGCGKLQQCVHDHVMHERGCGKLQRCAHVIRSCRELQQSDRSDVDKSLLNRKRDRGFGSQLFLSEKQNPHDFLERSPRSLQGESIAQ